MRPIALFAFSLTAFLSACATQDPGQDPTGTWVGSLIADQGTCPTSLTSTLRIRGKEIMFTPETARRSFAEPMSMARTIIMPSLSSRI